MHQLASISKHTIHPLWFVLEYFTINISLLPEERINETSSLLSEIFRLKMLKTLRPTDGSQGKGGIIGTGKCVAGYEYLDRRRDLDDAHA